MNKYLALLILAIGLILLAQVCSYGRWRCKYSADDGLALPSSIVPSWQQIWRFAAFIFTAGVAVILLLIIILAEYEPHESAWPPLMALAIILLAAASGIMRAAVEMHLRRQKEARTSS